MGKAIEVTAIHLNEVNMEVREEEGTKYLVMGPLALVLPLDAEGIEWLERQLAGAKVQVYKPGDLPSV